MAENDSQNQASAAPLSPPHQTAAKVLEAETMSATAAMP